MNGQLYSAVQTSVPGLTAAPHRSLAPDVCRALEEPDKLRQAQMLRDVCSEWFRAHAWYYREAAECKAFYAGFHWGFWSEPRGLWETQPRTRNPDEVRLTVNIYGALMDQGAAMLTQDDPHFDTAAVKNEIRDVAASEATSQFTDYWWRQYRLGQKYRLTGRTVLNEGTALIYVRYDQTAGPMVDAGYEMVEPPEFDELGLLTREPVFENKKKPAGGMCWDILPVDGFAPDPSATSENDGAGVFLRFQKPRSWLYENYPEAYAQNEGTPYAGVDTSTVSQESTIIGRTSTVTLTSASLVNSGSSVSQDMVWIYVWYGRQTPKYPRGTMRVFAQDGALLDEGDNPVYPVTELGEDDSFEVSTHWPVIRVICDEREGSYWGMGRGPKLIGPQKAINGLWSKALQHAAKIANAKMKLPAGLSDSWNDQIGQVFRIPRTVQADQIGYVAPPSMVQEYGPLASQMQAHMEYLFGVNAATQGQLPSSDTSGIAIGRLQQRDMTRMAPIKRNIDAGWAEAVKLGLKFWRRWSPGKVKALVAGPNKATAVKEFDSSSFSETTDIQAFNNTFLPSDPSQRMVWLSTFAQTMAQVQDPRLRTLLIRMTNIGDFASFLDNLDPDDVKARRNNLKLLRGESPMVLPCDHALTNKAALEELMKSEEWEDMVRQEEAAGGGQSVLKQKCLSLWNYYSMISMGMDPQQAMAQSGGGGSPAAPSVPAEPPMDGAVPTPPPVGEPSVTAAVPMPTEQPPVTAEGQMNA